MNQSEKQVVVNKTNIENLKKDVSFIKLQVSNHIPTSIRELDKRLDKMEITLGQITVKVGAMIAISLFLAKYFLLK